MRKNANTRTPTRLNFVFWFNNVKMFPDNSNIKGDLDKRLTHLVQQKDSVEYILPTESLQKRFLYHDIQTGTVNEDGKMSKDGRLGMIRYYYIPKSKHDGLLKLFREFNIPEHLYDDLKGAYLNMFFAKCTASYTTEFEQNFGNEQSDLSEALNFLSTLALNKINITKLSIEYQEIIPDTIDINKNNFGDTKTKNFQGTMPAGIFEEALKLYQNAQHYEMFKSFGESSDNSPALKSFMGHKNAEKQSQSYYSFTIFEYLTQSLFSGAANLFFSNRLDEYKALTRKYSKNHRYLFIGRLMVLSELDKDKDDDVLRDTICKRINPYRRRNKK